MGLMPDAQYIHGIYQYSWITWKLKWIQFGNNIGIQIMRPASTIGVFIGGTNKNKGNDVQITRKTS